MASLFNADELAVIDATLRNPDIKAVLFMSVKEVHDEEGGFEILSMTSGSLELLGTLAFLHELEMQLEVQQARVNSLIQDTIRRQAEQN